jgi:hypothetical protein
MEAEHVLTELVPRAISFDTLHTTHMHRLYSDNLELQRMGRILEYSLADWLLHPRPAPEVLIATERTS